MCTYYSDTGCAQRETKGLLGGYCSDGQEAHLSGLVERRGLMYTVIVVLTDGADNCPINRSHWREWTCRWLKSPVLWAERMHWGVC